MALLIYGMVLELNAIGGTDYSDELTDQLLIDTANLTGTLGKDQIMAALVLRQFINAGEAGAAIPSSPDAAMPFVTCLEKVPGGMLTLERILLFLFCQLGRHESYPQT